MNLSPRRDTQTGETTRPALPPCSSSALQKAGTLSLAIVTLVLVTLSFGASSAHAQAWSLTRAQRQSYLQYYAPVILKRGDENDGKQGRDWLANFDFDRDGNFSNNRLNWRNINQYVAAAQSGSGAYNHWRIRPTLYTSLIEYMNGGSKSLVLLYHVYNAADKDGSEIHDWERVEIVVHGVGGTPGGGGEYVNHVTVTLHKHHLIRRRYDSGLNFMQTATGKHVLLWQADESGWDAPDFSAPYGHELHHVSNPYSWVASQVSASTTDAEVNVSGEDNKKNVHYVFAPEGSSAATTWNAKPLSYSTASSLASRFDNGDTVDWYQVKRITYELQDLADILPTHWQSSPWYLHWLSNRWADVQMESPIINEAGQTEVSTGLQRFYTMSRDAGASDLTDDRDGYLSKPWFYGSYSARVPEGSAGSEDFKGYEGIGLDSYGYSRGAASGYYNSHNAFWWQHDFFVHSGVINLDDTREEGMWLRGAWYAAFNGGFDGRWVQLFDDRPDYEAPPAGGGSVTVCSNKGAQYQCELYGGTWNYSTCTCDNLMAD